MKGGRGAVRACGGDPAATARFELVINLKPASALGLTITEHLMVDAPPPAAPQQIATNIMIHWNGSTEQARANAFAMPLLHLAERVTVLTVIGGQDVPGPSADQVRDQLWYNNIASELVSIQLEGRSTGEAVLAAAKADGCHLLIKGAFTRTRLRQTIFGGATKHITTQTCCSVPAGCAGLGFRKEAALPLLQHDHSHTPRESRAASRHGRRSRQAQRVLSGSSGLNFKRP
jgi:hypothetical protein